MTSLASLNTTLRGVSSAAFAPAAALNRTAKRWRSSARDMTVGSVGIAIGAGRAAKVIYDMEDTLNEIEGRRFGKNDTFALASGVEMSRQQFRQSVVDLVSEINQTVPRTADEIMKAYNQLVQAGLTHEQVQGILGTAMDFAIAGNYDTEEAADKLTNVMTSMNMAMATQAEAEKSARRAADVISYAANNTNSSVHQMTEAFKYAAPSAAALGIEIEQLAAMFLIQARRGIKGSEAGVSIRAMLTRMVRPTNMAAAALERYNIDLADYLEKSEAIKASDVLDTLAFSGLIADGAAGDIQRILDSSISTGQKVQQITQAVMKAVGDETTMSAEAISNVLNEVLFGFGETLDVERLIADMQAAGISMSDFFRIFDVRQGARTLALFGDDLSSWVERILHDSNGFAEALRRTRMQGVVGAWARFTAGLVEMFRAIADSGVLERATSMIDSIGRFTLAIRDANPKILQFGTFALLALAALAPLGFVISGITSSIALLVNPLTWVVGAIGTLAVMNFGPLTWFFRALGNIFRNNLNPRIVEGVARGLQRIRDWWQGMRGFGSDGEAWARAARQWGEGLANAVNRIYATLERIGSSEFMRRFGEGLVVAFDRISWAAGLTADGIAYVLEKFEALAAWGEASGLSGSLGRIMGEIAGYSFALGLAAVGLGIVARPLRAIGRALAVLSGIKLAWGVTRFIARLALLAGSAAAIGALASSIGRLAGATTAVNNSAGGGRQSPGQPRQPGRLGRLGGGILGALGGKWTLGAIAAWTAGEVGMERHGRGPDSDGYADRIREAVARQKVNDVQGELLDATEGWSQAATRSMFEYVNALVNGGAQAEAEASRIGQEIEHELNVTGHPDVNTDRLERALAIARELAGAIREVNGGGGGGNRSGGSSTPRRFGGARRRGGPVEKGLTYAVGEEGVELFTAERSGRIIPNNRLGGGGGVTVHVGGIKVFGGDGEKVAREFIRALDRALLRSRQVGIDDRPVYEGG